MYIYIHIYIHIYAYIHLRFYGLLAERFCLTDYVYQVRLYYNTDLRILS